MAAAFLAISEKAQADIHYVEVDVSLSLDDLLIDFDGDGIDDAQVLQTRYGFSSFYLYDIVGFNGFSNQFVGTGSGFIYPSALNSGVLIGASGSAVPNVVVGFGSGPFSWRSMNYGSDFGYWIPAFAGDTIDAYLGVEFLAGDGNIYNAWIRCKVPNASEVIVVSYAWEDSPGMPIAAGDTGPLGVLAGAATGLSAADIGDNGNGTDLELRFTRVADESFIGSYRAIAVKTADVLLFDLAAAEALAADQYVSVAPTGSDPVLSFGATTRDAAGDLIAPEIEYRCFVLSMADGTIATLNELSDPSNPITLLAAASPARNVSASDVGNNGNGSDMRILFDNALDESTVLEYRIIVVDSVDVASFDLAAAEAVGATNYTPVTPIGGVNNILLTASSRNSNGDLLANDLPYRVFVLSIADGTNAQLNQLSDPSNPITLRLVSGIDNPQNLDWHAWTGQGTLFVSINDPKPKGTIKLYSLDGRQLREWAINQPSEQFSDLEGLSGGPYVLEWSNENSRAFTRVNIW